MPGSISKIDNRFNTIDIILIPNPIYILKHNIDTKDLPKVDLVPHQIEKVEIIKSYNTHTTEVYITFTMMSPTMLTNIVEGKYIVEMHIGSQAIDGVECSNIFICASMGETNVVQVYGGGGMAVKATGFFKSVTKTRLDIENAFAYELGGKGNNKSAGANINPYSFFNNEFRKRFLHFYAQRGNSSENDSMISTKFSVPNSETKVATGPSSGYIMNSGTNFDTLTYFFENYPLYKTIFGWVLDDFNTVQGFEPTTLFVSDFIRWDAWENSVNTKISKFFNPSSDSQDKDQLNSLGTSILTRAQKIDHKPKYNFFRYGVREDGPKIFAVNIADQSPIPMNTWNSQHQYKYMMVAGGYGYAIRQMDNPMYKEYFTFMSEAEIAQVQQYNDVFQNLHPELITYSFSDLYIGEVDLNTIVQIDRKSLADDENYGFDRIGLCYQVKHTYTQTELMSRQMNDDMNSSDSADNVLKDPRFTPMYSLTTEATFLFIDKGAKTLKEFNNLNISGLTDELYIPEDMAAFDDCNSESVEGGNGSGIPGNTDIADQGKYLVDNKFKYVWGGTSDHGMDCSAFVQKAVRRSNSDSGYNERYPRTTTTQYAWCRKHAIPIDFEHRQRGDIVFFKSSNGIHGHTGVFSSPNTVLEASSSRGKGVDRNLGKRRITGIFRVVPKSTKDRT
jgi:hypothetical protein